MELQEFKDKFAEWGLWSLVEDISDDGDGTGDNLQLTKQGEEAVKMIIELMRNQLDDFKNMVNKL
jgi:hypothetical protein